MIVRDLIRCLEALDQELEVVTPLYSEHLLLEADQIKVKEFCETRNDGWVEDARPDKQTKKYVRLGYGE